MSSNSSSGREDPHERADLKLVDEAGRPRKSGSTPASGSPEGASRKDRTKRRGLPVWIFALVVLVLGFALIRQLRVAAELESKVTNLQSELTRVSVELEAHQNRLQEIRSGVHDLSASLENLRVLVDTDPGESVSTPDGFPSDGAVESVPAGEISDDATDKATDSAPDSAPDNAPDKATDSAPEQTPGPVSGSVGPASL